METKGVAEKRYNELESDRASILKRGQASSELTIPSLLPQQRGNSESLKTPFQGIGARGVNNLASKLLLTLFPPNSPIFKMMVDDFTLKELESDPEAKTKIEKALGAVERAVMTEVETSGDRVQLFEAIKHLIVTGNILIYITKKDGLKVFHLDKYVVKRDPMGNVLEIVTQEFISPNAVPKRIRQFVKAAAKEGDEKTVGLYTHVKRVGEKFEIYQEVKGQVLKGESFKVPVDKSPFLALRFTRIDGEDYGRSFIEEYYGDLHSLEKLTKALVEGSAAAARVLFLTDPNGSTKAKTLAQAPNGAIRTGSMRDISVLQLDKFADFRVTLDTMQRIEERLSYAFMLNSSVQRKGERVTAEEIRYLASELEDSLGGVYSILSKEMQLPYITVRMGMMQKQGRLPALPKKIVKPSIVTGMEALGRGQDLRKLDSFLQGIAETLGAEVIQQYVNLDDYISRRATAVGIDTDGLIKTKDEIAKQQQAAQQQSMMSQVMPAGIDMVKNMAQEGMKNGEVPNQIGEQG